jgi:hypothetical protein
MLERGKALDFVIWRICILFAYDEERQVDADLVVVGTARKLQSEFPDPEAVKVHEPGQPLPDPSWARLGLYRLGAISPARGLERPA